jgi:hypothetical protein
LATFLAKGYTFHRNQDPCWERHHLGGTPRGRVFRKEFTVNFVDHTKVIAGNHENGRFDDFVEGAARFLQDNLDVLKTLSGLVFEVVANNFTGIEIVTGGTGDENEIFGYYGLWKGLTHSGGLCGVEVSLYSHSVIFYKKGCLIAAKDWS